VKSIFDKMLKIFKRESKPKLKNGNSNNEKAAKTNNLWLISIFLILVILTTLMLPHNKSYKYTSLKEGEVYIGEEIIAPFNFAINKSDDEYKNDLRRAEDEVFQVFTRSDSISRYQLTLLKTLFDSLLLIPIPENQSTTTARELTGLLQLYHIKSSDEIINNLTAEIRNKTINEFMDQLTGIANEVISVGILSKEKDEIKTVDDMILVITNIEESHENISSYYDQTQLESVLVEKLRLSNENSELRTKAGYEILKALLKPNVIFDAEETKRRITEAKNNVPLAKGTVLANERIIDKYERITKSHITKLNSLAIELAERESGKNFFVSLIRFLSRLIFIGMILAIFVVFLAFNRPKILKNTKHVILISLIFLIVIFLAFNINRFNLSPYLIPVTIGAMLLTIFFDNRIGFVGTIVLALIIGSLRGNEFNISLISIFTGIVAVISVHKIRTRNWVVNSILLIVASYIISITILEVLHYTPFRAISRYWMYGVMNGFLAPLFAYGLQVIFENIFDIVTDMRLLELSDLNSRILRKLAIRAPGTYHHSLMVGNLAEAAAEAIGAKALLSRVGSYYHDIGKIEKPEYFIENQIKSRNPHEKLSPSMSCLILTNHVRKGLEIAKEEKLPKEIRDFIAEHHGTNMMSYFYQKAEEKVSVEEIDESNFRYPGPKPSTKETGIVMLADAIEAASRTLKEPSASRIRGMVKAIVQDRFKESELDECPLTLRELTKITDSFETVLLGTFHARIEYPDQDEKLTPLKEKKTKEKNIGI